MCGSAIAMYTYTNNSAITELYVTVKKCFLTRRNIKQSESLEEAQVPEFLFCSLPPSPNKYQISQNFFW